ncbi:hypothetical protein FPZ49_12850 [Paenibacillus cremeus]|uniref:Uncharacterized protein n=2 Tax=Paenibacillus cremeus TaxID=2163881 RepID=A0A559KC16_9BACL|nr:hypothetical protein FPZ49_12850 [Paenibacillus cremeus]
MRKWALLVLLLWFCCVSVVPPPASWAEAESSNKELLQKGLTLFEIDQELTRITNRQDQLNAQLQITKTQIQAAAKATNEAKQHAAKVVRAYYMGDRDSLWLLFFSIRSLSDALSVLEYLQMILQNDQLAMGRHREALTKLQSLQSDQLKAQTELAQSKDKYLTERTRMVALQKEVDEQLARTKEAAKVQQEMVDLNRQWQDKGIPLFKTYFTALAQAMKQLPESFASGTGSGSSSGLMSGKNLTINPNGLSYTFQMTDQELNDYLKQKNELFRNMTFHFTTDQVIASGKQDDIAVTVKGTYQIATKEETNKTYIRYKIQELRFNDFTLPQSTVDALEKQFDLGIYPQNIASFLQVTGIKLEDSKMSIFFKLAL